MQVVPCICVGFTASVSLADTDADVRTVRRSRNPLSGHRSLNSCPTLLFEGRWFNPTKWRLARFTLYHVAYCILSPKTNSEEKIEASPNGLGAYLYMQFGRHSRTLHTTGRYSAVPRSARRPWVSHSSKHVFSSEGLLPQIERSSMLISQGRLRFYSRLICCLEHTVVYNSSPHRI
jgi:hypothetical protein